MNTFTITTPDAQPFPLGERWTTPGRRFRTAALFGAVAALVGLAIIANDSADASPTACPRPTQAWPSGDEIDRLDARGWPGETPSSDMFAAGNSFGVGFGIPGESASVDMFALSAQDSTNVCL